ncbi:MAG: HEAT repeat domain-containing protein [Cytophagales bacterium]|nr:HEAT repeat domain-containing protein [Cytophagales bacterium]
MKEQIEKNWNCDIALEHMLQELGNGQFDATDLEAICEAHPDCEKTIRESYILWHEMDAMAVPEPSENMRGAFLEMLAEFEKEENSKLQKPTIAINWNQAFRWAAVFIIGLLIGLLVQQTPTNNVQLADESPEVSKLLAVSNPTTDRLLAIQQIKEIRNPQDPVIEALNETLMKDPNVNVRLSAIEAMVHFIDHPKARTSLVAALPYQDSPIVQLTLAQLLINLHSDQSLDELNTLINSADLDHDVKLHLKETLNTL